MKCFILTSLTFTSCLILAQAYYYPRPHEGPYVGRNGIYRESFTQIEWRNMEAILDLVCSAINDGCFSSNHMCDFIAVGLCCEHTYIEHEMCHLHDNLGTDFYPGPTRQEEDDEQLVFEPFLSRRSRRRHRRFQRPLAHRRNQARLDSMPLPTVPEYKEDGYYNSYPKINMGL